MVVLGVKRWGPVKHTLPQGDVLGLMQYLGWGWVSERHLNY